MSEMKFKLRKPITDYGKSVEEITLHEPTVDQLLEIGAYPFTNTMNQETEEIEMRIKPKYVKKYISVLGNLTNSAVSQLDPKDFFEISNALMGFFTSKSETETTSDS